MNQDLNKNISNGLELGRNRSNKVVYSFICEKPDKVQRLHLLYLRHGTRYSRCI